MESILLVFIALGLLGILQYIHSIKIAKKLLNKRLGKKKSLHQHRSLE